jgi:hypothetical protein
VTAVAVAAVTVDFNHLIRLTDDTGLFEHARHATVRREHGYCTDDVARGLLVTSREPDPSPAVLRLAECYLTFLAHAQDATGAFHNRLGHDRRWSDEPGLGDWWGRAVWGLGTAAARSTAPWIRREALGMFLLGAAEVLRADPGNTVAAALLRDAAAAVGGPADDPLWPWPLERLSYGNASLAEVVVAAGHLLRDDALLAGGLRMLRWLHGVQESDGRLSVVAAGGWRRDGPRERYDQQPIEVAALADAAATATAATGQRYWDLVVRQAAGWFLGDNDGGVAMWDPLTGGGFDGLTPDGPNLNQGAESTLAFLSTMQVARGR